MSMAQSKNILQVFMMQNIKLRCLYTIDRNLYMCQHKIELGKTHYLSKRVVSILFFSIVKRFFNSCFIIINLKDNTMPQLLYTIEEYIVKHRKKDTIWMVFNTRYNEIHALHQIIDVEDEFGYYDKRFTDEKDVRIS